MPKKLTTEEFIARAKEKHPDYDYSETVYINKRTKIQFRCSNPEHGTQWQLPENHIKYGCNECGNERAAEKKRKPWEKQLEQFHDAHGDDYDYSNSIYVNVDTPIEIKCKKCGYVFYQTPYEHQIGSGCPICAPRGRPPKSKTENNKEDN
jgi:predicted  nucleic acid-binding Zn-ribbon protein